MSNQEHNLSIQNNKLTSCLRQTFSPEGSNLRNAQMGMLDLLIFLDKICIKNNLRYWLDSGTLIGAMRHGGFIPWDDDVDVCMPREDALKLKQIMTDKIFEGHIILQNDDTDPNYINSDWMTLRDTKIEYIQNSPAHNRLKYRGLQVDIFSVDQGQSKAMKFFIKWVQLITVYMPLRQGNILSFIRPFVNLSHKMISKILIPAARHLNKKNGIYNYSLGVPFCKYNNESSIFPLDRIKFESYEFNCPNDCDAYLNNLYGDWRQIPDEMNIRTHEVKFAASSQ